MADFDDHAHTYSAEVDSSVSFTGKGADYFAKRKADELLGIVERNLGDPSDVMALDVGCGVGVTDGHLSTRFSTLHGVDLAADAVEMAREANPSVQYRAYDGRRLPFEDSTFDLAFAVCVLHHVEPCDRGAFTADMTRVVRPGGLVVVFEHNPFNPLTRVAVSRCEFDEGVVLLTRSEVSSLLNTAKLDVLERRYILFLPIDNPRVHRIDRALGRVPFGGQHYVAAVRPL